jgi:hypothetical protein
MTEQTPSSRWLRRIPPILIVSVLAVLIGNRLLHHDVTRKDFEAKALVPYPGGVVESDRFVRATSGRSVDGFDMTSQPGISLVVTFPTPVRSVDLVAWYQERLLALGWPAPDYPRTRNGQRFIAVRNTKIHDIGINYKWTSDKVEQMVSAYTLSYTIRPNDG